MARKTDSGKRSPQGYTIGRQAFAKISAVDGLRTSSRVEDDFRSFEKRGLPASERRKRLVRKYGTAR
jgi:hypothetical protein